LPSDMKLKKSTGAFALSPTSAKTERSRAALTKGKIWIGLDNSPHVPFLAPIIDELHRRSSSVVLTARDCFQVHKLGEP
jgi:hypothetical protein